MNKDISVSILDSKDIPSFIRDLKSINEDLKSMDVLTDIMNMTIHFDVMDNKFVPNNGINIEYIKLAKSMGFYCDVHLMVEKPIEDKYIEKAIEYGADSITIHYEIECFEKVLKYLNDKKTELKNERDLVVGVALKPSTSVSVLKKYSTKFSKLLLMSVEPGYGGQEYIKVTNDKIKQAKDIYIKHTIQVDGGVNSYTCCSPLRYGVNSLVMGSFLSKSKDRKELFDKILIIQIINTIESLPRRANMKLDTTTLQVVPGGYGENDILLGINVPDMRKCVNIWKKYISLNVLSYFISSKYHDYRRFAVYNMSCISRSIYTKLSKDKKDKKLKKQYEELINFFESNLKYINNWDLTDEAGPNILAFYLLTLNEKSQLKKVLEYLNNKVFWIKRIGIVSMLTFARNDNFELPFKVLEKVIYDEFHLFQKASGWVLREMYKKRPDLIVEYLSNKNSKKTLPTILLSYSCERMSAKQKEKIKII